ncbi:MAG: cytochrome c oxidase assembly protein [Hyphomicrobiales bacterium]
MTAANSQNQNPSNRKIAVACVVLVGCMVGLAYASVPLYRLFCQVTGYAGTTQRAEVASETVLDRQISVRFDSNVGNGLAWNFKPVQREVKLKIGEQLLAFYRAENLSKEPVTGTAIFNVTPAAAGAYFNKIECFCFTEQVLQPGQRVDMPVSFFIDPEIDKDADLDSLKTITLSYTFYPAKKEAADKTAEITNESGIVN